MLSKINELKLKEPIILVLLFAWWSIGITCITFDHVLWSSVFGTLAMATIFILPSQDKKQKKQWTILVLSSIAVVIGYWIWNLSYYVVKPSQEQFGIFRFAAPMPRFPFYGKYWIKTFNEYGQQFIVTAIGLLAFIVTFKHKRNIHALLISAFLIIGFNISYSELLHGIENPLHYDTFAEDVYRFPSFSSLFTDYTDKMGEMSVHNNHYPPGNLAIMYLQDKVGFNFAKLLTILSCIFGMMLLPWLTNVFGYAKKVGYYAILLFGASTFFLIFPAIAISPLVIPFVILAVGGLVKSQESNEFKWPLLVGMSLTALSFFTLMWMTLPLLFVLLWWFHGQRNFLQLVKTGIVALSIISSFYLGLYALTEYSIIELTLNGMHNNSDQMSHGEGQNLATYIFASTGNFISFIGFLGVPVAGFFFLHVLSKTNDVAINWAKPLLLFIAIMSFSGSFYLEVERIWIIFVPIILVTMAAQLDQISNKPKGAMIAQLSIALSLISSFIVFATTAQ